MLDENEVANYARCVESVRAAIQDVLNTAASNPTDLEVQRNVEGAERLQAALSAEETWVEEQKNNPPTRKPTLIEDCTILVC